MSGPPRHLGPWEILEEIGRGGYGAVYRARHSRTGAPAAVKLVLAGDGATPEEIRRFQREIALARTLDHPGIVKVLDVGDEGTRLWYAMELVEGRPLYRLLAEETLPWRRAVEIARDVADALAHAHARGVLHRDVKPGNILVGRKWGDEDVANGAPRNARSAFLADFGLARLSSSASRLTRTGMALGTPEYMSPEQAQGEREKLGPPTDVWGVGCVLYEMLAGRLPFEGTSAEHTIEAVVLREPVPLRRVRPDAPPALERVVRVCLAKRPSRRYRDAGALRDDLDRVLRGERPQARPPARWGWRVAAAAFVAAVACWAGWLARESGEPELVAEGHGPPGAPSRAESLAGRARALRATDPREAARLLGEALALERDQHECRIERGLLLWAAGDGPGGRAEWQGVPATAAAWSRANFYMAIQALGHPEGFDFDAQLEAIQDGSGRESTIARAILELLHREWASARALLRGLPGWEAAMARGYLETMDPTGDPAAAVREYGVVLAEGLHIPWVHQMRAVCRNRTGDPRGAIEDADETLRVQPASPEALEVRANARGRLGDHVGALEDAEAALKLRPRFPGALLTRGTVRGLSGDLAGALRDFDAALDLDPGFEHALFNRAYAREQSGDLQGSLRDYDALIRVRPDHVDARHNRGSLRARLGDDAGAEEDLEVAHRARPDDPLPLGMLGRVRRARRDWAGAADAFRGFLRLAASDSQRAQVTAWLAECEEKLREERAKGR
ncbi:MAG: protein kinase [Planctomycetales bacterium]|nr:protein kinase [Planctomycetales bacterium]